MQVIEQTLADYRSPVFPFGVLIIATQCKIEAIKKGFNVTLTMPFPCVDELQIIVDSLTESLHCVVSLDLTLEINAVRQHNIAGIKNIIAVASGKGGVGKSTTAVNIAYALIAEGAIVGILDADIYGPSIPTMLGIKQQKPTTADGKKLMPLQANELSAMSIGFLVAEQDATVWRGPMASSAFSQLLNETAWQNLDYLIIDMPPGTGDIQLTLSQKVPVAAAVIVTTPQDIALTDAQKGISMFEKVKVPVLGIIENMSYHVCEKCGHHSSLFGEGGGAKLANSAQTSLLGQLPLTMEIRSDADNGLSAVNENSTGEVAKLYRRIAQNVAAQLYYQLDMRSPDTPNVLTEEKIT